jgi:hypothetical protein
MTKKEGSFWGAFLDDLRSRHAVLLALYMILALGVLGPFGTFSGMDLLLRFAFWGAVVLVLVPLSILLRRYFLARGIADLSLLYAMLQVGMMTLLGSPFVWFALQVADGEEIAGQTSIFEVALLFSLVTLIVITLRRIVVRLAEEKATGAIVPMAAEEGSVPAVPVAVPRLLRRLTEAPKGEVLYLAARDHFVDVVMAKGEERLRLRFADAVDEMDGVPGVCAHRSYWVALAAVQRAERRSGKTVLLMTNGDEVPVSRTYMAQVEAAGLL